MRWNYHRTHRSAVVLCMLLMSLTAAQPVRVEHAMSSGKGALPGIAEPAHRDYALTAAHSSMAGNAPLPQYVPPSLPVPGALRLLGTAATVHLAEAWGRALQEQLLALQVQAQSFGITVTPPWWQLTRQPAVAVLSEPMSEREITEFTQQFGYQPTRLLAALNAVAVVVHRDHPLAARGLTLAELDGIFSTTQLRGHAAVQRWGDLGLDGVWAQRPISMYGHDASASLLAYFQRHVLQGGTLQASVARLPSSAAVVDAVGHDLNAIGYAGLSFLTPDVAVVPLAAQAGLPALAPTPEHVVAQHYPLTVLINLYINWEPGHALPAPVRELVRFVYSWQGQQVLARRGYVSLPVSVATAQLRQLGLTPDTP